jgi:hypothetical protein
MPTTTTQTGLRGRRRRKLSRPWQPNLLPDLILLQRVVNYVQRCDIVVMKDVIV